MAKKNDQTPPADRKGFLARWSKQKLGTRHKSPINQAGSEDGEEQDTLEIDKEAEKERLSKKFHTPQYNRIDRLDDYDEDYSWFESLGDILTHEVKGDRKPDAKIGVNEASDLGDKMAIDDVSKNSSLTDRPKDMRKDHKLESRLQTYVPTLDKDTNALARSAALRSLNNFTIKPTSAVYYTAGNSLLVLANRVPDGPVLDSIRAGYKKDRLLIVFNPACEDGKPIITVPANMDIHYLIETNPLNLDGYLGNYRIATRWNDEIINLGLESPLHRESFDVVLDLMEDPVMKRSVTPFGYISKKRDGREITACLSDLAELQGQFQKPKFFNLDESICAHASSGQTGCRNCIEVCPAEAITSIDFTITVDPYLCQGCGTCTSVCPTGAMVYAYPRASDTLNRIRLMLGRYLDANGSDPFVLFYGSSFAEEMGDLSTLPDHVLPCEVEEIASVGMEVWLATLAYGADHVILASHGDPGLGPLEEQLVYAREILQGMGYTEPRLHLIEGGKHGLLVEALSRLSPCAAVDRANFAGLDEKRTVIRLAIEHLMEHAPAPRPETPLSRGAPFGRIEVNRERCTLCMSCASLCPKGAIAAGGDTPVLKFIESECVQCGLCESGCPEDAIQLFPRYLYERDARIKPRVLNEEQIFSCIRCGKPFATQKMIRTIMERLKDHAMFQGERIRHLQMCEDCRVKAQFDMPGRKQ